MKTFNTVRDLITHLLNCDLDAMPMIGAPVAEPDESAENEAILLNPDPKQVLAITEMDGAVVFTTFVPTEEV